MKMNPSRHYVFWACRWGGGLLVGFFYVLSGNNPVTHDPTWRYAWLVVEAGVVAQMLAFQGVPALPVVVAQFVVNGAMFLFLFQALPGGRSLPVPDLEVVMVVTVRAEARFRRRRGKNQGRMVFLKPYSVSFCVGHPIPKKNPPPCGFNAPPGSQPGGPHGLPLPAGHEVSSYAPPGRPTAPGWLPGRLSIEAGAEPGPECQSP